MREDWTLPMAAGLGLFLVGLAFGNFAGAKRIRQLEAALVTAEDKCRTSKGYPTEQSEAVAAVCHSVGVEVGG